MSLRDNSFKPTLLFGLVLSIFAGSGICATLHVPSDYSTIEDAVDAANEGDVIILAEGEFTGEGNRGISFDGKALTLRSENGPYTCVINCEEIGRAFNIVNGEVSNTVIQGITIYNGFFQEEKLDAIYHGGAVKCVSSSPTFVNCRFLENRTKDKGGAVFCDFGANPVFFNCMFTGNSADLGGAVYMDHYSHPEFYNCTIADNSASVTSSAIECSNVSSFIMTNSIVWDNSPSSLGSCANDEITYSNVLGLFEGEGNINDDPIFRPGFFGSYYLTQFGGSESPCVDAGSDAAENIYLDLPEGSMFRISELTTSHYGNLDSSFVDMGFHYLSSNLGTPTITPTSTITPTPTETPIPSSTPSPHPTITPTITQTPTPSYEIRININDDDLYLTPGDRLMVDVEFRNFEEKFENYPLFVALEYQGNFWFWDGWTESIDFNYVSIPLGMSYLNILDFLWPETGDATSAGFKFWAVLLDQDFNLITNQSEYSIAESDEFGFGSAR